MLVKVILWAELTKPQEIEQFKNGSFKEQLDVAYKNIEEWETNFADTYEELEEVY